MHRKDNAPQAQKEGIMSLYAETIKGAFPRINLTDDDVREIEDVMRHTIFHSTLDWQTRKQLQAAARRAWQTICQLRKEAEFDFVGADEQGLRKWYLNMVGYDPMIDDPGMTVDALREMVADYIRVLREE